MAPVLSTPAARLLDRWVRGVVQRRVLVLLVTLAATVGFVWVLGSRLRIDTNLDHMLDEDLPFRQANHHFTDAFPQFVDNLILVVEADTPEGARDAALELARRLEGRPDLFAWVDVPRAEPFLEAHALYYLDRDELFDLGDRLAQVQPFLGRLTRDGSLRGLFDMLGRALDERTKGGEFDVGPLVRELTRALAALEEGRAYRVSWQALMKSGDEEPDDLRQFIQVRALRRTGTLFPAGPAIETARALFADLASSREPAPRLRITGGLAMEHEELSTVTQGAEWISLATFVLVGLVLALGLKSWRLVLASLVTLLVGLLGTATFAALAVGHLNMISVAFGVLYIGLGVDYAIHLGLRYREAAEAGRSTVEALAEAAADVGGSLLLCTLTTSIGFYAFVPTAYRGVSELGLISGTGMFISLFVTLTVMPALLAVLPVRPGRIAPPRRVGRGIERLGDLPLRHARGVLLVGAVVALGALALLPRATFDLNPVNLRDPDSESVATFRDLLATSRTPQWSITLLAPDATVAQGLEQRLDDLDVTDRVVSLRSFVAKDQDAKVAILDDIALALGPGLLDVERRSAPDLAELRHALDELQLSVHAYRASQAGALDEDVRVLEELLRRFDGAQSTGEAGALFARLERSVLDTLPESLGRLDRALAASPFALQDIPEDLARRWRVPDGPWRVEAFPADNLDDIHALRGFVRHVQAVDSDATGAPVMIVESGYAIVGAFQQALLVSAAACVLVLFVLLRRLRQVVLVLVPLLFAAAVTGAFTVVAGTPFNFANVIALPLLFGVGVDSGIHIVHRARTMSPGAAHGNPVRTSTGRAVIFSALTTICGFGNLAFSPHPGTASMGLLLTVGIFVTLLATVVLLPALARGLVLATKA